VVSLYYVPQSLCFKKRPYTNPRQDAWVPLPSAAYLFSFLYSLSIALPARLPARQDAWVPLPGAAYLFSFLYSLFSFQIPPPRQDAWVLHPRRSPSFLFSLFSFLYSLFSIMFIPAAVDRAAKKPPRRVAFRLFLLMTVFAQALLSFMSNYLMSFLLLTARHSSLTLLFELQIYHRGFELA